MKNSLVITGDISGFTKVDSRNREILVNSTRELMTSWAGTKDARIFRGDSFQMLFHDASEGLKRCIQLRCWFKKNRILADVILDARMAIGVGEIAYHGESVLDSDGEAFHLSGRGFDAMENDEFFKVITANPELNKQLAVICNLLDLIISGWTRNQAEVIYLILEEKTQQQMADELSIVQSAINNRLKLAHWKQIEKTIHYISGLIQPDGHI
jgi:hypothetical protein